MEQLLKSCEEKMEKSLSNLIKEFSVIRTGRANPSVLDKVSVDYYGTMTPINQLATVSVPEAKMIMIQPWDVGVLSLIEKAIYSSDLGLTPTNDGKVIRIVFPDLTEERRKEIAKSINKLGEESKISMRNIRRDAIDKLKAMKKNSEITEDDYKVVEKKIQNVTDKYCKNIDTEVVKKQEKIISI